MPSGFREGLAVRELQGLLRDLLCLAAVGDHVRWVLVGDECKGLADWLTEAIAQWRSWADQVAKHLVTLRVAPDGRVRSSASHVPVLQVPDPDGWLGRDDGRRIVEDRLRTVVEWARYRRSQATAPDTVHLLDMICVGLEAQARSCTEMATSGRSPERISRGATPGSGHGGSRTA